MNWDEKSECRSVTIYLLAFESRHTSRRESISGWLDLLSILSNSLLNLYSALWPTRSESSLWWLNGLGKEIVVLVWSSLEATSASFSTSLKLLLQLLFDWESLFFVYGYKLLEEQESFFDFRSDENLGWRLGNLHFYERRDKCTTIRTIGHGTNAKRNQSWCWKNLSLLRTHKLHPFLKAEERKGKREWD